MDPGECIAGAKTGAWGYKYQCNGTFRAHLGFTYNNNPDVFYIPQQNFTPFGEGHEPYEQAKVIACCGEYDDEEYIFNQPTYGENCMLDFRQQACRSIAHGLATLIDNGTVPLAIKPQATDVQNWIAARTTECIAGLVDTNEESNYLEATWQLPNDGPWEGIFEDVYLEIDFALISDLYSPPAGPDVCTSLRDNDDIFFTDQSGTPFANTYAVELDEADGVIDGPIYSGARVSGTADFASLSTSCTEPFCSTASFSVDSSGSWAIDSMVLHVDGSLIVSNGTLSETITDGRVELYTQAQGYFTCTGPTNCTYTIPAGDAHFIVVGASSGDVASLPLPSSTEITATLVSGGVWLLDPFEIGYTDDLSNSWTLTVGSSEWL